MKKLIILLSIFIFFICGCSNEPKESTVVSVNESKNITVYITETGKCYHLTNCSCLKKSKIEYKLNDAVEKYRPCQLCFPPVVSN